MATIKDVARACGVSVTTVSYVINDSPRAVHPETRKRILEAIRRLNYHPSAVARGLQRKRMNTLGVVFPHEVASVVTNPFFAPILDGILDGARVRNQNTCVFTGHNWSDALHSLPVYADGRCDGLLLIAPPAESDIVPALQQSRVPFVLINDDDPDPAVSSIDVDHTAAAETLVRQLIGLQHRRIAFLPGGAGAHSTVHRRQGYRQALESMGITYDTALVPEGHYTERSGYERTCALMDLPRAQRPTALFCGNDAIAMGALKALRESDARVPEDVSVVGFDDTAWAATSSPPLTTVRQPLRLFGERAVGMLLDQVHDGIPPGRKEILPVELVFRYSTGPATRATPAR